MPTQLQNLAEPLLDESQAASALLPVEGVEGYVSFVSRGRSSAAAVGQTVRPITAALFVFLLTGYLCTSYWAAVPAVPGIELIAAKPHAAGGPNGFYHGVSLGGWLLLEINPKARSKDSSGDVRPSWMFDQIFATSELDFTNRLRSEHSDDFALKTLRNHWEHYISDSALDRAAALGVDAVRIPVGYWIIDPPVGGSTNPMDYGFQSEGFATGGLNHLKAILPKLAARGMVALIDMHALPCNSACVSDGMDCAKPLAFHAQGGGGAPIGEIKKCGGGTFTTSRKPEGDVQSWGDVGVQSVGKLAAWITALPAEERAVVAALQLGNEPALNTAGYDDSVKAYYRAALSEARASLPSPLPLVMSFIPPNDYAVPAFVEDISNSYSSPILIDHRACRWSRGCCATIPSLPTAIPATCHPPPTSPHR